MSDHLAQLAADLAARPYARRGIPSSNDRIRVMLVDDASHDLLEAIRVVATGEIYVRPSAARLLAAAVVPERTADTAQSRFRTLSDREQTVLRMVAEGYSGAEVARQLKISSKTVDAYKRRVQEKLGLEHRTDYVRFAIEAGILGRPA